MSTQHMYADSAGGAREITTAPPNAAADPTTTTSASASDGAAAGAASGPAESADIRITTHYQYTSPHFTPNDFVADPLEQFKQWFAEASPKVREPEGMCVSSVSPDGFPSSRMVLLRGVDARGWTFYTNYGSRKSRELAAGTGTGTDGADGGKVAVCWYWKETSRQIRAVGVVEKVSREDSEKYFASRPRGSQIGAWASEQSKVIREGELEERVKALEKEWEGKVVVCPEHWGGWRIVPSEVEFWAGHSSRLHDRFRYLRQADGSWSLDRLAP